MKRMIAMVLALAFLSAGCTGSFMLTKKVYQFHRSQEDKWMDELIFLGCVIIPVYSVATLGDAIVFNTIEFWTDENPIKEAKASSDPVVLSADDVQVIMSHEAIDDSVAIKMQTDEGLAQNLVLTRSEEGVQVRDQSGTVLYMSSMDDGGGVSVYDADEKLVKRFTARQMKLARQQLAQ